MPNLQTIGSQAFSGCSNLKDLVLGDVVGCGENAFEGCTGTLSIQGIAEGINSFQKSKFSDIIIRTEGNGATICDNAFAESRCQNVTIEPNVILGKGVFRNCSALITVELPADMTTISEGLFDGCSGLTTMTIPESVTKIEDCAFRGCKSLPSANFPESIEAIGAYAFSDCSLLSNIRIESNVKSLGEKAFSGCTGHLFLNCELPSFTWSASPFSGSRFSKVTLGPQVTKIGDYVFDGLKQLSTVEILGTIEEIGSSSFSGCNALSSINALDRVKIIGSFAFEYCKLLTSVDIHNAIRIGNSAFKYCESLQEVLLPADLHKENIGINPFRGCTNINLDNDCLIVDDKLIALRVKERTSYVLPEHVKEIGTNFFVEEKFSSLRSFFINHHIQKIDEDAFYSFFPMFSYIYVESCNYVGKFAFSTFPSGTTSGSQNVEVEIMYANELYNGGPGILYYKGRNVPKTIDDFGSSTIYILRSMKDAFLNDPSWSQRADRIKATIPG